jgi:hypothetical protein
MTIRAVIFIMATIARSIVLFGGFRVKERPWLWMENFRVVTFCAHFGFVTSCASFLIAHSMCGAPVFAMSNGPRTSIRRQVFRNIGRVAFSAAIIVIAVIMTPGATFHARIVAYAVFCLMRDCTMAIGTKTR